MSNKRYYRERDYKGDYGSFGTAAIFFLIGVLSLIFANVGITFLGLYSWGYWLFVPAFFIFISAIRHLYSDRRMRDDVLAAILSTTVSSIKLDSLAIETGIRPNTLLRILIDLRRQGHIKYHYDSESGDIIIGESIEYQRSPDFIAPVSKAEQVFESKKELPYCPFCGQKTPPSVQFCANCGSKLN